jgi:phosphoribosylglycinamide formyltransferase-1
MLPRRRIAILASGSGSNMAAIADACARGEVPGEVVLVISNVPDAAVLQRAAARDLPCRCIPHRNYPDRATFESAMLAELRGAKAEIIALAGFMRILTESFIREYYGSLLNVHPSLLPKYPGLNTHQRALDAGDAQAGATVHFVIPELDAGPSIVQAPVPVLEHDNARSLAERVQAEEHRIYPLALRWCIEGRVALHEDRLWRDKSLTALE